MLADLEGDTEIEKKPKKFYMFETEEEILAWRQGEKLAKKLKIPLNTKLYYDYAAKFIMGYMVHAVANTR